MFGPLTFNVSFHRKKDAQLSNASKHDFFETDRWSVNSPNLKPVDYACGVKSAAGQTISWPTTLWAKTGHLGGLSRAVAGQD